MSPFDRAFATTPVTPCGMQCVAVRMQRGLSATGCRAAIRCCNRCLAKTRQSSDKEIVMSRNGGRAVAARVTGPAVGLPGPDRGTGRFGRAAVGVDAAADPVDVVTVVERALERAATSGRDALESDFEYITDGTVESLDRNGRRGPYRDDPPPALSPRGPCLLGAHRSRRGFPRRGGCAGRAETKGPVRPRGAAARRTRRTVRSERDARRLRPRADGTLPHDARRDGCRPGRILLGDPLRAPRRPAAGQPPHRQGTEPFDRLPLDHAGRPSRDPRHLRDAASLPVAVGCRRHAPSRRRPVRPAVDPAGEYGCSRIRGSSSTWACCSA